MLDGARRNGMTAFRPYVYRGGGTDTLTPADVLAQLDAEFGPDEPQWPCGTPLGYQRGCRCEDCTSAESARKNSYRRKGTRR